MEQAVSSRWFTEHYLRILKNSVAVIDYSIANISFLTLKGISPNQLFYIPIDYIPDYAQVLDHTVEDYDVIFYGDVKNTRRQKYLETLGKHFSVKIINDLFGKPLYEFLARARIVVNIHYYPGALLETTRIWECLSLHKLVVSEYPSDIEQHADLLQLVDFVDVGDVSGMVERVRYWLENDNLRREYIAENRRILQRRLNQFDYFFYRFLLATDNITFEEFWDQAGNKVELTSDTICLSLPEYVERASEFNKDNRFGFSCFPGLRHSQSWIGCAMSYKFLSMLAHKHNLSKITICEDDVDFLPGFAEKWQEILDHLNDPEVDWDIFSGLLADLDKDVHIHEAHQYKGQQFATIDRLISMVFNVYSQRVFELISKWDGTNRDVTTNTIDRYIEKQRTLKILTVDPFLVGHKESQQSTLWGIKNAEYAKLILASNRLLSRKIRSYEVNTSSV
ncbi:Glycosyltransferase family 25 (LPS biosynthesis protein) [Nitrosospira multiformis]|nr:Glycosyltransferase family 25 (LPS biosynthesis protein) [Nitrosospira multiformis]